MLREIKSRRKLSRNTVINGVDFRLLLRTRFQDDDGPSYAAYSAIHSQDFSQRIGGARFRSQQPASANEVGYLAEAMSWKAALSGLPADGKKTVVYCPQGVPRDVVDRTEILAAHLHVLREVDPGVILGPDMNCSEEEMTRLAHVHDLGDNVSGLSEGHGGFSIDANGFTAQGLLAAVRVAAGSLGRPLSSFSMTVQGFGAVGAHAAYLLSAEGVRVVGVSSKHGALYSRDGLPVEFLFRQWQARGDSVFTTYSRNPPSGAEWISTPESLLGIKADIFLPAAQTEVLKMPDEPRDGAEAASGDVTRFLQEVECKIVVEGANHPLSYRAEEYLAEAGVLILPDYLVNCGGLIGCWVDWSYRPELLEGSGDRSGVIMEEAKGYIETVVSANVREVLVQAEGQDQSMRSATNSLARQRKASLLQRYQDMGGISSRDFARSCLELGLR